MRGVHDSGMPARKIPGESLWQEIVVGDQRHILKEREFQSRQLKYKYLFLTKLLSCIVNNMKLPDVAVSLAGW